MDMESHDYGALVGWIVLAIFLLLFTRFAVGRVVVYYALILMIVFVILTQAHWFANALAPFGRLQAGFAPGPSADGEAKASGTVAGAPGEPRTF